MTTMKVDFDKYLDIDVDNGICIWKDTIQSHRELIGREAGSKIKSRGKEYWVISIGGKLYKRAWVVFWKEYGRLPKPLIDHINGDSLDDRISNLREASYQLNSQNRAIGKKGRTLPMGVKVSWKNKSGECRYEARIKHAGSYIHLGSFATPEEASEAYMGKRKEFLHETEE